MSSSVSKGLSSNGNSKELLDSWKEIATFLNRGVRTVQRWQLKEGLPVHRHNHHKRGTVVAFASEIHQWQMSREQGNPAASGSYRYADQLAAQGASRLVVGRGMLVNN
jgi:hypothetical protein